MKGIILAAFIAVAPFINNIQRIEQFVAPREVTKQLHKQFIRQERKKSNGQST